MPYRVTTRATGKVRRNDHERLEDALDALEEQARGAAAGPRLKPVDLRARRWAPADQVAARVELKGPERWRARTRAGVDIRGDGSVQAWTGAPERAVVEPEPGEDAYAALRRTLGDLTA
jgi:hypothetical protein